MEEETTIAPTDEPAATPTAVVTMPSEADFTTLHLDTLTTVKIRYEASLGDLLIATLLMVLIVNHIMKWVYGVIWGRDK